LYPDREFGSYDGVSDSENESNGSESDSDSNNEDSPAVDLDDPAFAPKLNIILSDSIIVDGQTANAHEPSTSDLLGGLLNILQQHPDNEEQPQPTIRVVRGKNPINEIENNDILHYFAFPTLFVFARGLPEHCTMIPHKVVRHLFLQYHCRFAQEQRFYFVVFNQMQRHSVSRAIVPRVKNNKVAILKFMDMISQDDFIPRITSALQEPASDDAKLLTRQVMPLMTNLGATVPYHPSERRDMFPRLVSSMYRYNSQ
jgi:hypothetical protein